MIGSAEPGGARWRVRRSVFSTEAGGGPRNLTRSCAGALPHAKPSADPANGLVYLGTGNASPDYWIGWRRPFDDRFGSSIVALESATGKLRWMRQFVHRDMWDMDIPVGPSLFDYRLRDGRTVPELLQTNKMGQIYFLNRLTGAPITPVVERPAPQQGGTPGVQASPTQPWSVGFGHTRWSCMVWPTGSLWKRCAGKGRRSGSS